MPAVPFRLSRTQRVALAAITASPLMKAGGCIICDDLLDSATCLRLRDESRLSLHGAVDDFVLVSDDEELRGGRPARQLISAPGGEEQDALCRDPRMADFLSFLCDGPVRPTGNGGTYSYYARAGDHLALHRDIETCDVAIITCLVDRHHEGSSGGLTRYYPTRQHDPLSRIRSTPNEGAIRVRLPVGHTMIMLGGLIPHLIEPLVVGELRVVSILCFRAGAL